MTERICKNCGHDGSMHGDGEYTHTGMCVYKLEDGSFCKCKKFEELSK